MNEVWRPISATVKKKSHDLQDRYFFPHSGWASTMKIKAAFKEVSLVPDKTPEDDDAFIH